MIETPQNDTFVAPSTPAAAPLAPLAPSSHDVAKRVERQLDELIDLLRSEEPAETPPPLTTPPGFLLSVVIPVYNEAETIEEVVHRVERLPIPKEIVLVDDGSTDGTRDILRAMDRHRVILKERNEGKGAALRDGFAAAAGTVVVVQDADLEYHPAAILRLLPPLLEGEADVVYGSRFLGERVRDPSWLHRAGNAVLTRLSNWVTGLSLTDMETCHKAFRREVLNGLPIVQNRFGFEPEVTARLARRGCRFVEVPVDYQPRGYEEGKKIGWRDGLNAIYCILRYGLWE